MTKSRFLIFKLFILASLGLSGFFFSSQARAASFSLHPATTNPGLGQFFAVDLVLNSEDEDINAVEGQFLFPSSKLELIEISDGGSPVSFWVEAPVLAAPGEIAFSGIMPGGYSGRQGRLFSAVFKAKESGSIELSLVEYHAFLNDGQATQTGTKFEPATMLILASSSEPTSVYKKAEDNEAPEEFVVYLSRDPEIFGGDWFVSFSSQDKKSGISGYFVQEQRAGKKRQAEFVPAQSPYRLKDQSLESNIIVKALDRAGNERLSTLSAQAPVQSTYFGVTEAILAFFCLLAIISLWLWLRRRTKK